MRADAISGVSNDAVYVFAITGYSNDGHPTIDYLDESGFAFSGRDSEVRILGTISGNTAPKITTGTSPINVQSGLPASFSWNAEDKDKDDLSWYMDWGDNPDGDSRPVCGVTPGTPHNGTGRNWYYAASHAWEKAGRYTATVYVEDCFGGVYSQSFNVDVEEAGIVLPTIPLTITTPARLPKARVGDPYLTSFYASGLTEPTTGLSFFLETGPSSLPPGISMVSDFSCSVLSCLGSIGGTPTTHGTYRFTFTLTEGYRSVSKTFTLTVARQRPVVLGAETFNFTERLSLGSAGDEVLELQKLLNAFGYNSGMADGKFGRKTQTAVVQFQLENELKTDGIVGVQTRALLNE